MCSRETQPTSSNVHRTDRVYSETNLYSLLSGIKYVHVSFSVSLWSFSVSFRSFSVLFVVFSIFFGVFSVLFGPFRSLSVLFGVYSYPWDIDLLEGVQRHATSLVTVA